MPGPSIRDIELPLELLQLTKDPRLARFTRSEALAANGAPPETAPAPIPEDAEAVAARMWAAALRSRVAAVEAAIPPQARVVQTADTLQLIADIVNTTSGTALIGLILGTDDKAKSYKIVVAAVAVVTSLISMIVSFLRKNVLGQNRSDQLAALLTQIGQAEGLALRLEIWADSGPGRPPLDQQLLVDAQALIAAFISALQLE